MLLCQPTVLLLACRHFKNLIHGSLASILETLPSMMNAIHMVAHRRELLEHGTACGIASRCVAFCIALLLNGVWQVWVISRNYNTDERMVPLMERIATEIASKVNSIPTARARAHTHAHWKLQLGLAV